MIAYIDESSRSTGTGLMYVTAAAVVLKTDVSEGRERLRSLLLPDQRHLHWRDESAERRDEIIATVVEMGALVYGVACHPVENRQQERARARTLQHLLHRLATNEGVGEAVIEARDPRLNRRDASTIAKARRHGTVPSSFRFTHLGRDDDPMLWAADAVVGALAAQLTTCERPYFVALQPVTLHVEHIAL